MDPGQEDSQPATTEAASAPEPAAESPVDKDETADKAEELNIEVIMAEESAARDPWKQSTSRKLMIQVLPNRVCSIAAERADHRVRERCFRSDSGEVSRITDTEQQLCPAVAQRSSDVTVEECAEDLVIGKAEQLMACLGEAHETATVGGLSTLSSSSCTRVVQSA